MHVIDPAVYEVRPGRKRYWPLLAAFLILVTGTGVVNYLRPLPPAQMRFSVKAPAASSVALGWPSGRQAAVAADGYGILGTSGAETPLPTASIAKVVLALCVLQKQPLKPGEAGPVYTVDASDVALYQNYVQLDGSLLPVEAGEQLSEYQMLQALMIPSANNIADSLVAKVFGGQAPYKAYAAQWLQTQGLTSTALGTDGSGYDPSTTSTASDLAQLGLVAARNPAFMEIVGQGSANLPLAGIVQNYDTVLGQSGIDGIKTGNNAADLGAFLFSATKTFGSTSVRFTGSVLDAPNLQTALQESVALAAATAGGFEQVTVAANGKQVGLAHTAWGVSAPIVADKQLTLVRWKAVPITLRKQVNTLASSGQIGSLSATAGPASAHTGLSLVRPLTGPSFWWRLTRH